MTNDEQIALLQTRLHDVNNSIAQLETALAGATDSATRSDLSAQISQLQQTAETLRTMINNLSGSAAFDMITSSAKAKATTEKHSAAVIKSAKASARDSQKRAVETTGLMKMPRGVKRPKATLGE